MLNGVLLGLSVGFLFAIYNSLFVVEFPVTTDLVVHFFAYLIPWAIVGGTIGWLVGKKQSR